MHHGTVVGEWSHSQTLDHHILHVVGIQLLGGGEKEAEEGPEGRGEGEKDGEKEGEGGEGGGEGEK